MTAVEAQSQKIITPPESILSELKNRSSIAKAEFRQSAGESRARTKAEKRLLT